MDFASVLWLETLGSIIYLSVCETVSVSSHISEIMCVYTYIYTYKLHRYPPTVFWSKLDQWLDPHCGLDFWIHPTTWRLNTVHSFISFHIPGNEAWNTNNMQICGFLVLLKTKPVCRGCQSALLRPGTPVRTPGCSANCTFCLLAFLHAFLTIPASASLRLRLTLTRLKLQRCGCSQPRRETFICWLGEPRLSLDRFLNLGFLVFWHKIFQTSHNGLSGEWNL